MKSSRSAALLQWSSWRRTRLPLPGVVLACSLCFLAGLYGSLLFSQVCSPPFSNLPPRRRIRRFHRSRIQDLSGDGAHRGRVLEAVGEEGAAAMAHGESGEARPAPIDFQVLSWKPRAVFFPQFATPEQCQTVVKLAKSRLKPSTLALRKGETAESTKGVRTSSGTFISASQDSTGTLDHIEQKIARATMIPQDHGEAFNVLRYEIGQMYASHYDVFNPAEYGPQKSQRVASFLLYLSDVEEGGETMFPFENGSNMDIGYDYHKCIGLKVKPRQGDGLLFYSLLTNGTIDPTSLHGSCPVVNGEKWVATKWIRDQERVLM